MGNQSTLIKEMVRERKLSSCHIEKYRGNAEKLDEQHGGHQSTFQHVISEFK